MISNYILVLELVWSFFKITMLGFGGGGVFAPLMEAELVNLHGWLSFNDFSEIYGLSLSTPGAVLPKISYTVGVQQVGILGGLIVMIVTILPISHFGIFFFGIYNKIKNINFINLFLAWMRPVIFAMIASLAYKQIGYVIGTVSLTHIVFIIIPSLLMLFLLRLQAYYVILYGIVYGVLFLS